MMRSFRFIYATFIFIGFLFVFSACSKSNDQTGLIPADAAVLVQINGKSLDQKLPWAEIKNNPWFSKIISDSSGSALWKSILEHPENSGIDLKNNLFLFTKTDSLGAYVGLVGTIKDNDKFISFSSNITKTTGKPDQKEDIFFLKNNSILSSWRVDKFLILIDAPSMNMQSEFALNQPLPASPAQIKSTRNLTSLAESLYALKEKESLGGNEQFNELLATSGDIRLWINSEAIYADAMSMNMGPLSMINMDKLYKGAVMTACISFEDGKILSAIKAYAGEEMTNLWKKYSGNKINVNLLERLPSENIAAEFAVNFKPQGIVELLKISGMDGLVNLILNQAGVTADDFVKAIKGDVFFAVTHLKKDSSGISQPQFLFAATINDQPSLNKLIDLAHKMGEKEIPGVDQKVFFEQNKTLFAIGNNEAAVKAYVNNKVKQERPIHKKLTESAIAGYIDFQYLLKNSTANLGNDSLNIAMKQVSQNMWNNMVLSGGKFVDGGFVQNIEVNLINEKENSLKQLNQYVTQLYNLSIQYKPTLDSTKKALQDSLFKPEKEKASL